MNAEELIAKAIHDVDCADVPHCTATPTTWSRYHRFAAASVAALSGRLLPEGGQERTEEGVEVHGELVAVVVGRPSHRRIVRTFPDGSSYVGPWSEVTE